MNLRNIYNFILCISSATYANSYAFYPSERILYTFYLGEKASEIGFNVHISKTCLSSFEKCILIFFLSQE